MKNGNLINDILDKVRTAAACSSDLHLTKDEIKLLADGIGHLRMVPVLTMGSKWLSYHGNQLSGIRNSFWLIARIIL